MGLAPKKAKGRMCFQGFANHSKKWPKGIWNHRISGCMGYFDQIMVSKPTANGLFELRYWKAGIYNKSFLIQNSGQYKGGNQATPFHHRNRFSVFGLYLFD
jgi:hypothetical protein